MDKQKNIKFVVIRKIFYMDIGYKEMSSEPIGYYNDIYGATEAILAHRIKDANGLLLNPTPEHNHYQYFYQIQGV